MAIELNGIISQIAADVSSHYNVPVPLSTIAESEDIKVFYDDYGKSTFDGLTWFEPSTDDFYIHLNTNPFKRNFPKTTKGRFTLAHELGHYFIPYHRKGLMNGSLKPHGSINYLVNQAAWKIEREADAFASMLLMPYESVRAFIKRKPFSFELIEELALTYNVSKSAAALRYVDIGDTPIMVVYAVNGKIRWTSHRDDFPFWRLKYGSGKGNKVPEYTVMGTFFYDKDDSDCNSEETIFAKDCFDTPREEDNYREFYEWCIPYIRGNSALSIIWEQGS